MPEYIKNSGVVRTVASQCVCVSSVNRKVVNGYTKASSVTRQFFASGVSAITNFKKVSKGYNYVYFSWTNPTANYTGIRIQAQTGSQPTTVNTGTNVYHGVGTNTVPGGTNTSGKVSINISKRVSTTYYFSVWAYFVDDGVTKYSGEYRTDNAALICYDCGANCNDCCDTDCDETQEAYCKCDTHRTCCDLVERCDPHCDPDAAGCGADCGSVYTVCDVCNESVPGTRWDCDECDTCGDCINYPDCGDVKY